MILYFIFVLEILKDILEKNMERALFLLEKSNLNQKLYQIIHNYIMMEKLNYQQQNF